MLEKWFKLSENKTTVKTEILAGITTFMTMAYILAVNPSMLGIVPGMSNESVFLATAISATIGCFLMAFLGNYPFALAPGMGLNAYFTYTVCLGMGVPFQTVLLAVFVEGLIFILLSVTNVREAIFNAIPMTLKYAVSGGIGLFIAFIGLQGADLIINDDSTLITYQKFGAETFNTAGISAILALIGIIVTGILAYKKVKGSILIGILLTWVLGMLSEVVGLYVPNAEAGYYTVFPALSLPNFSALGETFGQCFNADFSSMKLFDFIVVMFAFLFVDMFDTLGTLIGVASKANMLDEKGRLPRVRGALLADAIATAFGAILGTSTTTTYVESASGVAEGGRTGLTAVTTGILFAISILFAPIFLAIPGFATAPALVIVGFYMMASVVQIDFNNYAESIPAFLCIIAMPFAYSISEGIAIGVISYVIMNIVTGKENRKKLTPLMYVLAILFVFKYILCN